MKQILSTRQAHGSHWVGDGFPVQSLFTYQDAGSALSPFLLLDHAGPHEFTPTNKRRGVGEHPHRGFETVTIVFAGEVDHRDSSGGGGRIKPGDVQWMTAASGLVHDEFHSPDFSKSGGLFHMVQLWVNLPSKDKMSPPRYQGFTDATIPKVKLPNDSGLVRVIAGNYNGQVGPAKTFTSINLWDVHLNAQAQHEFIVPAGHTATVVVLSGQLTIGEKLLNNNQVGILDKNDDRFSVLAQENTHFLFLGGEPINEPIIGYGPFVMNTMQEIEQAVVDFQEGRMGNLDPIPGSA